jgi:hypothetical protein
MANKRSGPTSARSAKPASRAKGKPAAKGPTTSKRVTPRSTGRYTPPVPKTQKVSPPWVPVLMFSCLLLGMLMIILNYVNVLPSSPSNAWLLGGLGLITVGFITATKYH